MFEKVYQMRQNIIWFITLITVASGTFKMAKNFAF